MDPLALATVVEVLNTATLFGLLVGFVASAVIVWPIATAYEARCWRDADSY